MRIENVPCADARYWSAMLAASICGVNLGDFVARILHFGHWSALPLFAILFAAVIALEKRAVRTVEITYWLAVLIGRTAATNLSDVATHDLHWDYGWVIPVLLPLLIAVVAFGKPKAPVAPERATIPPAGGQRADGVYWLALFLAEIVGTAIGDAIPDVFDLAPRQEYLVFALLLVATFRLRRLRLFKGTVFYWVTIVVIAAAGLSIGDAIAHAGRLWLGTLLTALLFTGLLAIWPSKNQGAVRV